MSRLASTRSALSITLVLALFAALLAGASLFPDSCLDKDCCATRTPADNCGTICCTGIQASPEEPIVLVTPSGSMAAMMPPVQKPEPVVFEPLIRPPIAA